MNKIATIAGLVIAAGSMTASADVLLEIDLSVENMITISATDGLASADASASNFTGYLMAGLFNAEQGVGASTGGDGNFSTFANASDGSPSLFSAATSFGLNMWSFSSDSDVSVSAGTQAFSGSSTFELAEAEYLAMLAGNTSGDIFFGADTDDDIAGGAVLIGTWATSVPAPSSLALVGLGGFVATRRRR